MIDRDLAVQLFNQTNSFTVTGRLLGVSRQRIFQILDGKVKYIPPPPKPKKPPSFVWMDCPGCHQKFLCAPFRRKKLGLFCGSCYKKHKYRHNPDYREKILVYHRRLYWMRKYLLTSIAKVLD